MNARNEGVAGLKALGKGLLPGVAMAMLCAQPGYSAEVPENEPLVAQLVHADIPLFGSAYKDLWPQSLSGEDIGCASRVSFGIWKHQSSEDPDDQDWFEIRNYGVFHCAAIVTEAYERKRLAYGTPRYSFFVKLGTGRTKSSAVELWALQLGTAPGSDYILLSRPTGDEGIVKTFSVLQRICPWQSWRKGTDIDIFSTGYCAVNSQSDLIRLARSMAKRPPLGTLELVEDLPYEKDVKD